MNKAVRLVAFGVVLTIITTLSITSIAFANSVDGLGPGPAPSAGDGESEGPEWDERPGGQGYGAKRDVTPSGHEPGPAPNSGDGIPDGPGW